MKLATTNLNIRIDENLKRQSEEIFNELGLNMSTALTVFLRQTVRSRGIPFDMRLSMPNDETLDAMREGNEIIKSGKARFDNAEDMFKALKS